MDLRTPGETPGPPERKACVLICGAQGSPNSVHHACYLVASAFPAWPPCSKGGVKSLRLVVKWSGGRGPGGLGPKHWGCKAGTRGADGSQGGSARSGLGHVTKSGDDSANARQRSCPALTLHLTSHRGLRQAAENPETPVSPTASPFSSGSLVALKRPACPLAPGRSPEREAR